MAEPTLPERQAQTKALQEEIAAKAEPYPQQTPQPIAPEVMDSLHLAREKVVEKMPSATPEEQANLQAAVDDIDAQLLRADRNEVAASRERVATRGQSPPATEPAPPGEGGTSSLFKQAQKEAGVTVPESPTAAGETTRPAGEAAAPSPVGGEVAPGPSAEPLVSPEQVKLTPAPSKPLNPRLFEEYFHGSEKEIGDSLSAGSGKDQSRFLHEEGIWFAPNMGKDFESSWPSDATRYAGERGTIVKAKLDIKNPYYGDVHDIISDKINAKWLRDHGYDAFVDDVSGSGMVVVLDPKQVAETGRLSNHGGGDYVPVDKPSVVEKGTAEQTQGTTEPAPVSAEGVGAKLGPGAANIEEPLASYELRKFGERFVEDKTIEPTIREQTGNRYYEPIPNRVTADEAVKIINERGIDESIRLVRDEKNDLSHAVRSTIGQVAIKQLNESYRALKDTNPAEAEKVLDKTVDLAEWQMDYGTRLGQGVQSFAMWSRLTPEGQLRIFERGLEKARKTAQKKGGDVSKIPELTDEIKTEITRLSQEVEAAPEGIPKQEAAKKLADYMASKTGYSPWDLPLGIYYTHILSGYNTHLVNAIDTGFNVFSDAGVMALNNPRSIPSIFEGLMRGFSEGKSDAILALTEGRTVASGKFAEQPTLFEAAKFGTKGGVPISEVTRIGRVFKKAAESKAAYPLNAYKYVSRIMAASDTVFYRAAQEARAAMLAHREAYATGKEKAAIRAEMNRVLGYDRINEFRKQAEAEGYKGAKKEARTTELMIQSRPEVMREASADFAGASTYNHAPEGLLGYFSNKVAQMTKDLPVLKLIVPFTRIVANVTNRGLDYTPYGYKRALAGRTFGEGKMTGDARAAQLTKATVGTMGLIGMAILNQTGVVQVHGGGPSDPQKRRQLQAAGWKPYSLQIGDEYISYLPTPLGLGLSSLGNYLDSNRYQELKQKDAVTRTTYSVSRIPSTVFNQSFLSNLAGTFRALSSSSPGEQISELKKLFSRTASGFVTPALAKDMNRVFDPGYRDSDSLMEDVIRDIPVARLKLRPSLNAYGEVAEQPSNRFVSTRKSDPAWRIVVDKNLRIPVADETIFTTPEAGYEYQKLAGIAMKRYVSNSLGTLLPMTTDQAQESINRAWTGISETARSQVRSRFPNSLKQRK